MCCGTSYLKLIDSCITQLKVQGPSRTCNESKEEKEVMLTAVVSLGAVLAWVTYARRKDQVLLLLLLYYSQA